MNRPTCIKEKENGIEVRIRMGDVYVSSIEWGYGAFVRRETLAFKPINEWTVKYYDPKNNTRTETFRTPKAAILAARQFCIKGAVNLIYKRIPIF